MFQLHAAISYSAQLSTRNFFFHIKLQVSTVSHCSCNVITLRYGNTHRNLFIFVLYKDSSDFLMSNVCWVSDELMGGGNIIAVLFRAKE